MVISICERERTSKWADFNNWQRINGNPLTILVNVMKVGSNKQRGNKKIENN